MLWLKGGRHGEWGLGRDASRYDRIQTQSSSASRPAATELAKSTSCTACSFPVKHCWLPCPFLTRPRPK